MCPCRLDDLSYGVTSLEMNSIRRQRSSPHSGSVLQALSLIVTVRMLE